MRPFCVRMQWQAALARVKSVASCHPSARTVPASRSKITAAPARPIGSTPSSPPTRRGSRSALSAASAEASTTIAAVRESRPLALVLFRPRLARACTCRPAAREPLPIVSDRERVAPAMASDASVDLESLIRRVIREECGITAVTPAEKWRGGTLVLRPGTPGLQEKACPSKRSSTRS